MPDKDQYTIEILDVTLDVIEHMSALGAEPQPASKIAGQLGINRTRVLRILKTLERRGYSEADPAAQGCRLGLKFLEIGQKLRGYILRPIR